MPGMFSGGLTQDGGLQPEVCQLLLVLLHQSLSCHTLCMLLPQLSLQSPLGQLFFNDVTNAD